MTPSADSYTIQAMETNHDKQLSPAQKVRDYAAQTMGSENLYGGFCGLKYTDGIKFLAETCKAYWLIDVVGSHQPAILPKLAKLQERDFQVWRIRADGDGAAIDAWTDTPGDSRLLAYQQVLYTDFPRELLEDPVEGFQFWVENGIMMLKQER